MATNFPASLDSLTNPSAGDSLSSPSHAAQHANVNDAVEALQAKVGVDGSAVTSSLDYKVAQQGLTFVKSQTIGTGVSSVTVTDAFSSTFDNYKITISEFQNSANQPDLKIQFGSTTANYYAAGWYLGVGSGSLTAIQSGASSSISIGSCGGTNSVQSFTVEVLTPYVAERTRTIANNVSGSWVVNYLGYLADTNSYTSFTILFTVGTMTGGTIRVYGYNNG
jgi:hypothetical protein